MEPRNLSSQITMIKIRNYVWLYEEVLWYSPDITVDMEICNYKCEYNLHDLHVSRVFWFMIQRRYLAASWVILEHSPRHGGTVIPQLWDVRRKQFAQFSVGFDEPRTLHRVAVMWCMQWAVPAYSTTHAMPCTFTVTFLCRILQIPIGVM